MSMYCDNPITMGSHAFGCGQCMACRFNKRRKWKHRIMLEAKQHQYNAFVTLTYSNEKLPKSGSVVLRHTQGWLKRLRARVYPQKLRYFVVGEYGDDTERPHYHAGLFGYRTCHRGRTRTYLGTPAGEKCCPSCTEVYNTWGMGGVLLGSLEANSAQYIAGYVTKKMTNADDLRLRGRAPEFARMSLRPGIGSGAMWDAASVWLGGPGSVLDLSTVKADVPSALTHEGENLPLDRYMRNKWRERIGELHGSPKEEQLRHSRKLLDVQKSAIVNEKSFKEEILSRSEGKRASMKARDRIYKSARRKVL